MFTKLMTAINKGGGIGGGIGGGGETKQVRALREQVEEGKRLRCELEERLATQLEANSGTSTALVANTVEGGSEEKVSTDGDAGGVVRVCVDLLVRDIVVGKRIS